MSSSFKKPMEGTSFRKKGTEGRRIPGTKVSYQNVQLLTSSGVPSLDSYLGGGIAIGTIFLLEEDVYNTYSKVIAKYFVAEGVTHSHSVILASGNDSPEKLLKEIPLAVEPKLPPHIPNDSEDLKIAWRYKDKKLAVDPAYTHNFDLSKTMSQDAIEKANIITYNPLLLDPDDQNQTIFLKEPFRSLFMEIKITIQREHLQSTEKHCSKILRVAICSLGSPLWTTQSSSDDYALLRFMYMLRSLLRSSFAVAFITVPATLLQMDLRLRDKARQMSDYVVQLESFVGSKKSENALIKDFDGLIHLVKLPVLNTFAYPVPVLDLAFKLKRKTFHIEQMHLPPDVEDPSPNLRPPCGAASSPIDF